MTDLEKAIRDFRRRIFEEGGELTHIQFNNLKNMLQYLVLDWKNTDAEEENLILMVKILHVLLDAYLIGYDIEKPHTKNGTLWFGIKL